MLAIPITESSLYSFLEGIKGVEALEIETLTLPKTIKGCPYDVSKITVRVVRCGTGLDLATEVEANQAAEGHMPNYSLSPRVWGTKVKGTPFIKHKDEIYLPCIVESNLSVYYIDNDTGDVIPLANITPWLVKTKEPKKQAGLVKKAIYRSYNLNAIMSVKLLEKSSAPKFVVK